MSRPTFSLAKDQDAQPVQALGADDTTTLTATVGGTAAELTVPTEWEVMEVTLTIDAYIKFGSNPLTAVTSSGRILLAGVYVYKRLTEQNRVSFLRVGGSDGKITVTRLR